MSHSPATSEYIDEQGCYRIDQGDTRFECTAKDSGRIVTFSHGGKNILTGPSVNPFNFGSTFWTGPQSDWDWPPPKEIDSDTPFAATLTGEIIELKGPPCPALGVQITKRYSAVPDKQAFKLEYEIKNITDKPVTYAPWEISRVGPGGLTFFPTGNGAIAPVFQEPLPVEETDGITWFTHSKNTVPGQHKLFADGAEGWIAHVDGDLLFIKTFKDHPMSATAPGEAEIEIYAVPEYVEVEQQGSYREIPVEERHVWCVHWRLIQLAESVSKTAGNSALVAAVRKILG